MLHRRLGERDAEEGVDGHAERRQVVAGAAHFALVRVDDQVAAATRHDAERDAERERRVQRVQRRAPCVHARTPDVHAECRRRGRQPGPHDGSHYAPPAALTARCNTGTSTAVLGTPYGHTDSWTGDTTPAHRQLDWGQRTVIQTSVPAPPHRYIRQLYWGRCTDTPTAGLGTAYSDTDVSTRATTQTHPTAVLGTPHRHADSCTGDTTPAHRQLYWGHHTGTPIAVLGTQHRHTDSCPRDIVWTHRQLDWGHHTGTPTAVLGTPHRHADSWTGHTTPAHRQLYWGHHTGTPTAVVGIPHRHTDSCTGDTTPAH